MRRRWKRNVLKRRRKRRRWKKGVLRPIQYDRSDDEDEDEEDQDHDEEGAGNGRGQESRNGHHENSESSTHQQQRDEDAWDEQRRSTNTSEGKQRRGDDDDGMPRLASNLTRQMAWDGYRLKLILVFISWTINTIYSAFWREHIANTSDAVDQSCCEPNADPERTGAWPNCDNSRQDEGLSGNLPMWEAALVEWKVGRYSAHRCLTQISNPLARGRPGKIMRTCRLIVDNWCAVEGDLVTVSSAGANPMFADLIIPKRTYGEVVRKRFLTACCADDPFNRTPAIAESNIFVDACDIGGHNTVM